MTTVRTTFNEQLKDLQGEVVRLGSFVIEMVERAMEALTHQDVALAEEVIRMDDTADEMDFHIEMSSMHLLALQQPMSRDLRTIATALRVITDLERIGDYGSDIAQLVKRLHGEPYMMPLDDIEQLAVLATTMVRNSVQSFVDRDIELAKKVCVDDDQVDDLYVKVFDDIIHVVESQSRFARQGANLILVARRLERVADHSTNVAERVYYMETGRLEQLAKSHKILWEDDRNNS